MGPKFGWKVRMFLHRTFRIPIRCKSGSGWMRVTRMSGDMCNHCLWEAMGGDICGHCGGPVEWPRQCCCEACEKQADS